MIRGLDRIIMPDEAEVGQFYLGTHLDGNDPAVFQCVDFGDGALGMLLFLPDKKPQYLLTDFYGGMPIVKLPPVAVRVDAPSADSSSGVQSITGGMFFVSHNIPMVAVGSGIRGWRLIDLLSGRFAERMPRDWISFSRWQLVIDDGGEEIPVVDFEN